MQIKFKRTHPDAKTPYHGTKSAAGYDLYAASVEELPHIEVDELSETDRGAGGFGSTGK